MSVEHEEAAIVGTSAQENHEEDEEALSTLSQALSQSTIGDASSYTGTQSSGIHSTGSPRDQEDREDLEATRASEEGGCYTTVFEEKTPNSSLVSRPIFRGQYFEIVVNLLHLH